MLTMVIMMMIILKTNNDDNACYREKVDGGDGDQQDEGGFHKGTPFTLSFTIPIKRTNVTMVFIFFILAHWLALKYGLSEWQKDGGTCTVHNGLIVATIDDDGGNNDQDDDDTWCTRRPWSVMEWRARTTKTSTLIDKNCW